MELILKYLIPILELQIIPPFPILILCCLKGMSHIVDFEDLYMQFSHIINIRQLSSTRGSIHPSIYPFVYTIIQSSHCPVSNLNLRYRFEIYFSKSSWFTCIVPHNWRKILLARMNFQEVRADCRRWPVWFQKRHGYKEALFSLQILTQNFTTRRMNIIHICFIDNAFDIFKRDASMRYLKIHG